MPSKGYKSITFSAQIYDQLFIEYQKCKKEVAFKGISSFAGYVTSLLTPVLEGKKERETLVSSKKDLPGEL